MAAGKGGKKEGKKEKPLARAKVPRRVVRLISPFSKHAQEEKKGKEKEKKKKKKSVDDGLTRVLNHCHVPQWPAEVTALEKGREEEKKKRLMVLMAKSVVPCDALCVRS